MNIRSVRLLSISTAQRLVIQTRRSLERPRVLLLLDHVVCANGRPRRTLLLARVERLIHVRYLGLDANRRLATVVHICALPGDLSGRMTLSDTWVGGDTGLLRPIYSFLAVDLVEMGANGVRVEGLQGHFVRHLGAHLGGVGGGDGL